MQELLLINPAKRRRRRKANPTKRTRARRRRNPAMTFSPAKRAANPVHRRRRKRNPLPSIRRARRRRNPIDIGGQDLTTLLKQAAIGGAGSVIADIAYGYAKPMLPASLTTDPISNAAAKAAVTALLGIVMSKMLKGTGARMTIGAFTVQAANFISTQLAPSIGLPMAGARNRGMGYYTSAVNTGRGPVRPIPRLGGDVAPRLQRPGSGMGFYLNQPNGMSMAGVNAAEMGPGYYR